MTAGLALGTVQFGLAYGVANRSGQTPVDEARAILQRARAHGIDTLDTAIAYGDSECRLGEIGVGHWRVVTKAPAVPDSCADAGAWLHDCVRGSLDRLRVPRLGGLLLHRSRDLLGPQGVAIYRAMREVKERGLAEKIGVSVYGPEELDALCPQFAFDLVQAPFNIVDRRLATSGWLTRLEQCGTEVHVRSAFLQGLLLMKSGDRPARFSRWQTLWHDWQRWLDETNLTPLQACLGFALSQPGIGRVVVGVDRDQQFAEILQSLDTGRVAPPDTLSNVDPELINPLSWLSA